MVTKDEMFAPMLAACPSFTPMWRQFLREGADASEVKSAYADGPLYYIALGDLAQHIANLSSAEQTDEFPAIFAVVENWIADGDEYVSNAAVVGLLEGLQNQLMLSRLAGSKITHWLGQRTRVEWDALNAAWGSGPT